MDIKTCVQLVMTNQQKRLKKKINTTNVIQTKKLNEPPNYR